MSKQEKPEIESRKVSKEKLDKAIQCESGIAANGGPYPLPPASGSTGMGYVDWDRPSPKVLELMVENPEFYLKSLRPEDRELMLRDLEDACEQIRCNKEKLMKRVQEFRGKPEAEIKMKNPRSQPDSN